MSLPPYVLTTESEPLRQGFKSVASVNFSKGDLHPMFTNSFHSRVWEGRDFISTSPTSGSIESDTYQTRHSELKKEVRRLLIATKDPFKELDLVGKIQQLGIAYHYEADIADILQRAYNNNTLDQDNNADLYHISLRFRLLRQAGFYVSPDIFKKYKDKSGEFQANLVSDIQGLLSLYEATFLSIQGEDILDYAQDFTTKHLRSLVTHLSPPLSLQVQRALDTPIQNGVERVHARHYISIYEEEHTRIETVLEFAKLDFNIVQSLHKKELLQLSECWERITGNVKGKLPFQIRDRMAEAYVICMGTNAEPTFSLGRIHLTKIWYAYSIIDDVHEVYGDVEELRPLHDAIQRWDDKDLQLVDYMRVVFQQIKNLFQEIEEDMIKKRQFIGIPYLKKKLQAYAKSQFEEEKLMSLGDIPTFQKWLSISTKTAQLDTFLVAAVMNMNEHATKEIFDWIHSEQDIITGSARIARLLDDIADFKIEKETISNMTCYLKEYGGSEQEVVWVLQQIIKNTLKDMNKDLLRPTPIPRIIFQTISSLTRNILEFYKESEGDGYTKSNGRTKEIITMLLRDPIPI